MTQVTEQQVQTVLDALRANPPILRTINGATHLDFPPVEGMSADLVWNLSQILGEGKAGFIRSENEHNLTVVSFLEPGHAQNAQRFLENLRSADPADLTQAINTLDVFNAARDSCMGQRLESNANVTIEDFVAMDKICTANAQAQMQSIKF